MAGKRLALAVDTVIVIEAVRINIWKAIAAHFAIETVDTCVAEAQTGPKGLPPNILSSTLVAVHGVVDRDRHALILAENSAAGLDDGERDLYAWLFKNGGPGNSFLVSTADKAAIVTATKLGWGERFISLEAAAKAAGVSKSVLSVMEDHFTDDWLSQIRLKIQLGVIP